MADRLLVSTHKGLFPFQRVGSDRWKAEQPAFLGEDVTLTLLDRRSGRLHAALNLGHFGVKRQISDDGGNTWIEASVPAYDEHDQVITGDGKDPQPAALKLIWALEAGGEDQPGRLWAGTAPGGLFRSDDDGETWTLVRSLWDRDERKHWFGGGYDWPAIHSICVDPNNSRSIRLAISCGGAWLSNDDGETWTIGTGMKADFMPPDRVDDPNIQDAHRMVQCPSAPEHMWVQHHCGIFRSTDAGKTWNQITAAQPSAFGFAVAVHPEQPGTAWFVPAVKDACRVPVDGRFVVTRTRDGGESFDVLSEGLPTPPAWDLVFRHGLAIDETGEELAMGSTTGGLWFSTNQGDTWQCLSEHLPPVNAVCFA